MSARRSVETLIELLNKYASSIREVNGIFTLDSQLKALLTELADLHIAVDRETDTLLFTNFVIPNVFTFAKIDQRITVSNHDQGFIVLSTEGAIIYEAGTFELVGQVDQIVFQGVLNKINYLKFYNVLRSADFVDHHNDAQKEFILYNSAKGILRIKYTVPFPVFTNSIDEQIKVLLQTLDNPILKIYLKNVLYEFATGNTLAIIDLINHADDVVSAAKRDQEIATKQFDFDKFRDSLYTQKDKFFTNIRDLLSKIYGQIIGIPISIAASVFTAYKIEHDRFVSALVLVSFLLYALIYLITQKNYYDDIQEIKLDLERDFQDIQRKSGLPEADVRKEKSKIANKLRTASNISVTLIFGVIVLGSCAILFIVDQMIRG